MKKWSVVALCVVLISAVAAQTPRFPIKPSADKRYLVDQQGKPFLYNADTGWKLFTKPDDAGVREYLTDRKKKKFNVIQVMLTGFNELNLFGISPFEDANDFSTLHPEYFQRAVRIVHLADSMGLMVAIAPLWAGCCGEGYGGKGAVGPTSIMSTNGPAKVRAYGQYVADLFKDFNNVMWIIGGDIDPFEDKDVMNELALAIKSVSPHQLMTFHASSSHSSTDVWDNPPWLDVSMTYTYFRGFEGAWTQIMPNVYESNFKEFLKVPVRPYFLGESTYESEHDKFGSATQVRKQAYWSMLTGGAGHAYGTPMWNFPENWRDFLDLPGGNSLPHLYQLFHAYPWYQLVPDPGSKIITSGQGVYESNEYALAASDRNGKFIVAYIPTGRTLELNSTSLKGKRVKASWFNPTTGDTTPIGKFPKSRSMQFKTPDEKDWVLIVSAQG